MWLARSSAYILALRLSIIDSNEGFRDSVGLGSDYDGIGETPDGLEDVSKYPALVSFPPKFSQAVSHAYRIQVAELYKRGWNTFELAGLTGGNLLRVMETAERVGAELQRSGMEPVTARYEKREDL